MKSNPSSKAGSLAADEALGVFRISLASIFRVIGVGAQRPTPPGERFPSRGDRVWNSALFNPVNHSAQEIELVERELASPAVSHAWNQIQAAPVPHLIHSAVRLAHLLVVIESIHGGKSRVTHAVIEKELSSVGGKAAQV